MNYSRDLPLLSSGRSHCPPLSTLLVSSLIDNSGCHLFFQVCFSRACSLLQVLTVEVKLSHWFFFFLFSVISVTIFGVFIFNHSLLFLPPLCIHLHLFQLVRLRVEMSCVWYNQVMFADILLRTYSWDPVWLEACVFVKEGEISQDCSPLDSVNSTHKPAMPILEGHL